MRSWGMFVVGAVAEKRGGALRELLYKKAPGRKVCCCLEEQHLLDQIIFLSYKIYLKKTSITRCFMGGKLHFYISENQKNHVYRLQDALCLYPPLSLSL